MGCERPPWCYCWSCGASGEIADMCVKHEPGAYELHPLTTDLGKCTIYSGEAINGLFHAKKAISAMANDGNAWNMIDVVSVVSDLGAHIAGSAAYCQTVFKPGSDVAGEKCAKGVLEAVSSLTKVAGIARTVQGKCSASATRLYLAKNGQAATSTAVLPMALAAVP